jgi:Flp pilus assembly protein TadD
MVWLGVSVLVVAAAAISLIALPTTPEWTSDSAAAIDEFRAALDAESKLYYPEMVGHLERAVELDPDFVAARVMLADMARAEGYKVAERLYEGLESVDLDRLQPRERFLVQRAIAVKERRFDDAARVIEQFLEQNPDDPFILKYKAARELKTGNTETAERLYRRVLEVSPNEVSAYNQLGYITLLQGRFAEAEEYFTSYRFIAPDQANPHDSLGELYLIQGRYEEAEQSFEKAIEIKSDFWVSYEHLVMARSLMGDYDGAARVVEDAKSRGEAPKRYTNLWQCELRYRQLEASHNWQAMISEENLACLEHVYPWSYVPTAVHQAAAHLGRWDVAAEIEKRLETVLEKAKDKGGPAAMDEAWPALLHLQGVRYAREGKLEEAEKRFREADSHMYYKDSTRGLSKLQNQTMLVETLLARGQDAEAHLLLSKVRAVNPVMIAEFEEAGLRTLGLERV